jgi:polysaccharide export outer membrane protein
MKRYLVLLILIIFLSACVSAKELTYFQEISISNPEIKRGNDTPYKLQIDSILNRTITSKNADIVADERITHLKKEFN